MPLELFPPQDRHKVLVLATTVPQKVEVPVSHWSLDDLTCKIQGDAHYQTMSRSTIQRILSEGELQPHKVRSWLHSDDPDFEARAMDICQLYLDAPTLYQQDELVLCTDEKTGIQALERKYLSKPMKPGQPEKREFEYIRHGTRCLLATFVVATGCVYGEVTARRTNQDYRRHLNHTIQWLEQHHRSTKKFHWVMDNLNTHWSLPVCRLFARLNQVKFHKKSLKHGKQRRAFLTDLSHRHVIHFTPKHGSWLNQVEMWFGVLTRRVIRRGNFTSKKDLKSKILTWIHYHNNHRAHPYDWTYTGKPLTDESSKRIRKSKRKDLFTLNRRTCEILY